MKTHHLFTNQLLPSPKTPTAPVTHSAILPLASPSVVSLVESQKPRDYSMLPPASQPSPVHPTQPPSFPVLKPPRPHGASAFLCLQRSWGLGTSLASDHSPASIATEAGRAHTTMPGRTPSFSTDSSGTEDEHRASRPSTCVCSA